MGAYTAQGAGGEHSRTLHSRTPTLQTGRAGVGRVPDLAAYTAQGAGGGHSRTLHSRAPTLQNGRPGVAGVPEVE